MTTENDRKITRLGNALHDLRLARIAAQSALVELERMLGVLEEKTTEASAAMAAVQAHYDVLVMQVEDVAADVGPELNLEALARRRAKKQEDLDARTQ